jgi:hypothetical protein
MRRGRTLFWTGIGIVAAALAVVIAVTQFDSSTSSPVPPGSAGASTQATEPVRVAAPKTSGTSSFSYLADLHPSGNLAGTVSRGPVRISGSIYPKSISFYCNVGDPTAFPMYKLQQNARRFQATIGLAANPPPQFKAALLFVGDGRTLRTVNVSVPRPKAVDLDVRGVHTLQLECFGAGNSATGGEAVDVAWGNARIAAVR